jgi:hypothetical protein
MNWSEYKALCNRPDVWSRWMLEQTAALLDASGEPELAARIVHMLDAEPLPKPADHKGGAITDMFLLSLDRHEVERIADVIAAAAARGLRTPAAPARGLGGFVEAWREYGQWRRD